MSSRDVSAALLVDAVAAMGYVLLLYLSSMTGAVTQAVTASRTASRTALE